LGRDGEICDKEVCLHGLSHCLWWLDEG